MPALSGLHDSLHVSDMVLGYSMSAHGRRPWYAALAAGLFKQFAALYLNIIRSSV